MRERLPRTLRRLIRPRLLGTTRTRAQPVSESFGYDRGTPIDRYYIERFLDRHRGDVRGRVLEVKDDGYARRYGAVLETVDVLDVDPTNPRVTIVADLSEPDSLPQAAFDCFILTQTLQYVFDVSGAVTSARRILRPGGVVLASVPANGRMTVEVPGLADHWHFADASSRRLFETAFAPDLVQVESHGNLVASAAFLAGLAAEELSHRELDARDPRFPVVITIRAVRE